MLTEDQIKNLKPGDIIYLNNYPVTFCGTNYDKSSISARDDASNCGEGDRCWFTREYLTMQTQPKCDPCRLFKKGDKVRVVEWNGRKSLRDGKIGQVLADEIDGCVELSIDGWPHDVYYHACMLELVTPVDEHEPYSVVDAHTHWDVAVKDMKTIASYSKVHHPNAKAAAEAERDRLNAEWRKEQNRV